jgi:hypothetical protein
LWLTPERRERLLAEAAAGVPWVADVADLCRRPSAEEAGGRQAAERVVRLVVRAILPEDPAAARDALAAWCRLVGPTLTSADLHKGHVALCGAVVADGCARHWGPEERARFAGSARALCLSFFDVSSGNPHSVANNWWAVSHSGLYCLAEALDGIQPDEPVGGRGPSALAAWAWGRLEAFLGHFGPGGAYHEGFGYGGYTCGALLPALILRSEKHAWRAPAGITRMARLWFAAAIEGTAMDDRTNRPGKWGRLLSWNDAGPGWLVGPAALLAVHLAPEAEHAMYRGLWDRLSGRDRDGWSPDEFQCALFFNTVFYPACGGSEPADPPLRAVDALHGLWVARNRWRDADDAVVGAYARGHHPGGHSQDDAGSIRFSARGHDWIIGGGQARPGARWQSRLVPSDACESHPACGSALAWDSDVPAFAMDLRPVHCGYSERYVALCPDPGRARLAVLDLVDDHRTDRHWDWCLTFSPGMRCELLDRGFVLHASDGKRLVAAFLLDAPTAVELAETPASSRIYASGDEIRYPGRPALVARFAGPLVRIFVSFSVDEPAPSLAGAQDFTLSFGEEIWTAPFGHLFPRRLLRSPAGQCRRPDPGVDFPSAAG